jgi:predicted O-methyltransferase YrrM
MENINVTNEEKLIFNKINGTVYEKYSEMAKYEREFLTALILRYKPKKVIELGISSGASSVVILNALKNTDNATLYSIDYEKQYYRDTSKECGFVVDSYPELNKNWKKFLGGLACNFLDEIGHNIDFAFIDTAHINPCEILDFLMVLPYLRDNAVVVFHDTSLCLTKGKLMSPGSAVCIAPALLVSSIYGKKIRPKEILDTHVVSNITAFELNSQSKNNLFEVLNTLIIPWCYKISNDDYILLMDHFSRFYPPDVTAFFERVADFQNKWWEKKGKFVPSNKITKLNYYRYSLLFWITFGKTRKRYKNKRDAVRYWLNQKG